MFDNGIVISVNISKEKGTIKQTVSQISLDCNNYMVKNMGIPEITKKTTKKKNILSRIFGYDIFLSFLLLFGGLSVLINNFFNYIDVDPLAPIIPVFIKNPLLLVAFGLQLIALACGFIFILSLVGKLMKGSKKKSDRVRTRTLPSTPSVPPHRVEEHNKYLTEQIEKSKEESVEAK